MLCSPVCWGELEMGAGGGEVGPGVGGTAPKMCCMEKVRVGARRRDPGNVGVLG